jgi:tight adherence protein C
VSGAGLLAAVAALLAAAAAREMAGGRRLPLARLESRLSLSPLLIGKLCGGGAGGLLGLLVSPAAPGRSALLVAIGMPAAGFFVPDALLERRARRRHRRLVAALPDALDLLAVSAASGRGPAAGIEQLARASEGPLAEELRLAVAELSCGLPLATALDSLRRRVPGSELATLVAAIERSRQFGSPLADQLRRQAGSLRRDSRRATEERAARAAPKIQLVVALVLVPSVLLMIAAGLIANAGTLLAGF